MGSREFRFLIISTLLVLAFFFCKQTQALKCYDCKYWGSQKGDEGCQNSPPSKKYLKECNNGGKCSVTYAKNIGFIYSERRCNGGGNIGCLNTSIIADEFSGSHYVPATNCFCNDKDGCNTGVMGSGHLFLIGINLYLLIVIFMSSSM